MPDDRSDARLDEEQSHADRAVSPLAGPAASSAPLAPLAPAGPAASSALDAPVASATPTASAARATLAASSAPATPTAPATGEPLCCTDESLSNIIAESLGGIVDAWDSAAEGRSRTLNEFPEGTRRALDGECSRLPPAAWLDPALIDCLWSLVRRPAQTGTPSGSTYYSMVGGESASPSSEAAFGSSTRASTPILTEEPAGPVKPLSFVEPPSPLGLAKGAAQSPQKPLPLELLPRELLPSDDPWAIVRSSLDPQPKQHSVENQSVRNQRDLEQRVPNQSVPSQPVPSQPAPGPSVPGHPVPGPSVPNNHEIRQREVPPKQLSLEETLAALVEEQSGLLGPDAATALTTLLGSLPASSSDELANWATAEGLFELMSSADCDKKTTQDLFRPYGCLNLDFFKVYPCDDQSHTHDRKNCAFYHTQRDHRRFPVTYRAEQCEDHFDLEGGLACPNGDQCSKCHNRHELLYHPDIYKQRFCSSYNHLEKGFGLLHCHRGKLCAFAHTREEIRCQLFDEEEERKPAVSQGGTGAFRVVITRNAPFRAWHLRQSEFFMRKFKTLWCPYGVQHDWHGCLYAHTYQDCRRSPRIGYGSEPCPFWQKDKHSADYHARCPHGPRCPYSHGSKEQLYHPAYYKTMPCADYKTRRTCPRAELCAFYHEMREKRPSADLEPHDYSQPIRLSLMHVLQANFMRPPLFNLDDFEAFGHASRIGYFGGRRDSSPPSARLGWSAPGRRCWPDSTARRHYACYDPRVPPRYYPPHFPQSPAGSETLSPASTRSLLQLGGRSPPRDHTPLFPGTPGAVPSWITHRSTEDD